MLQFLHPLLLLGLLLTQFTLIRTAWSQSQIKIHCNAEKAFCQLDDSKILFPNFLIIYRLPKFESKCREGRQSFCKLRDLILLDMKDSKKRCQSRECKPSDFSSPRGEYSLTNESGQKYELQYKCHQLDCLKEGFSIFDKQGNNIYQFYFSHASSKLWNLIVYFKKDGINQKYVYVCRIPMNDQPFSNEMECGKR